MNVSQVCGPFKVTSFLSIGQLYLSGVGLGVDLRADTKMTSCV